MERSIYISQQIAQKYAEICDLENRLQRARMGQHLVQQLNCEAQGDAKPIIENTFHQPKSFCQN